MERDAPLVNGGGDGWTPSAASSPAAQKPRGPIVWEPQRGPQQAAISTDIPDLCFGGARGGGKSDLILGDALHRALRHGEHFSGLILRRTFPELAELIKRSHEIYRPMGGEWLAGRSEWRMPGGGLLRMRYLENDEDAAQYQGHQYCYIAVDEAGQFGSPDPIDKLWGALRSPHGVPCVRRLTANPGGPGTQWLKKRYVSQGSMRPFRYQPQAELAPNLWIDGMFILSLLEHNVLLVENDPEYESRLAAVGDKQLYKAWRYGDWDVIAGQYFDCFSRTEHVAFPADLPSWLPRWISVDWGFTHPAAVLWYAWDGRTKWVYREWVEPGQDPVSLATGICTRSRGENVQSIYLSHDAFATRSSERSIALEMGEVLVAYGIPYPTMADNDRVGGWQLVYQDLDGGKLKISPNCPNLIETIPSLSRDPKRPEDIEKRPGDDVADSLRYGVKSHDRAVSVPQEVRLAAAIEGLEPNHAAMRQRQLAHRLNQVPFVSLRGGKTIEDVPGEMTWSAYYAE